MTEPGRRNFFYVFAGLLFVLLVIPLYRDLTGMDRSYVSELAFSVFLIISIWGLQGTQRWFLLAIALAIVGVGGNVLALAGAGLLFGYLSLISYIFFMLLTISLAVRHLFGSRTVDANSLVGAVCIYLLLGMMWSLFYVFVNMLIPDSFSGQINGSVFRQSHDFLYFSFVTLASLGYGDITPVRATARALATMEAIAGQFYVAVLVAGLVGAYLSKRREKTQDSQNASPTPK